MIACRLIALVACLGLSSAALAQDDRIVTGSSDFCSDEELKASFGARERFDGIMFSFVDGVLFTPCTADRPCDARTEGESLDLESSGRAWERMTDAGFNGWGYYRLRFEGRRGRWDLSQSCDLRPEQFYQLDRVISVTRIADR